MTKLAEETADDLLALYSTHGLERYGLEAVTQLEHALQSAAAAEKAGDPPAIILAALLHDIGHMIAGLGDNPADDGIDDRHQEIGADWLEQRLGPSVAGPVRQHVSAKRYLCATKPGYVESLAPDSVLSLKLQGGPYNAQEAERFLDRNYAQDAVRVRLFDDAAKDPHAKTPSFSHFLQYLPAARIGLGERTSFRRDGFLILRDFFSAKDVEFLEKQSREMGRDAELQLRTAKNAGVSPATLARGNSGRLIAVPEGVDELQVCRFEFLLGANPKLRGFVQERVAPVISAVAAEPFIPFKDKENEKHPGGGAFGAHQDFAAYQSFGPRYNITAMLTIDPTSQANGCLEFAVDWKQRALDRTHGVEKMVEGRPLLRTYSGGPHHGDILKETEALLEWQMLETAPADLVIFDSFVPHRSKPNGTEQSRRAMFLTFNAAREGDWYSRYYEDKRNNFDDPKFHISTPTSHSAKAG